jgi:thymidine kinase
MAKLYFYYSAMNAGKSTTLLQAAHNYEERGMRVLLFTPNIDHRAGVGMIASRIGLSRQAFAFDRGFDLYLQVAEENHCSPVSCVFLDEAQFLTPAQVLQLTLICDKLNIPVLCYGLRTDFRGEPFEGSKYLLAWADVLGEVKTICHSGKKATMNARLDEQGNQVVEGAQIAIGLNYVALSRKEFQLEKVSPIGYQPPDLNALEAKSKQAPESMPQRSAACCEAER